MPIKQSNNIGPERCNSYNPVSHILPRPRVGIMLEEFAPFVTNSLYNLPRMKIHPFRTRIAHQKDFSCSVTAIPEPIHGRNQFS